MPTDYEARVRDFATRFPIVADDLLEALDDYLSSDPKDGRYSLAGNDERMDRIKRLMRLKQLLDEERADKVE